MKWISITDTNQLKSNTTGMFLLYDTIKNLDNGLYFLTMRLFNDSNVASDWAVGIYCQKNWQIEPPPPVPPPTNLRIDD